MRQLRSAAPALLALLSAGCISSSVPPIPCASSGGCPTGQSCDGATMLCTAQVTNCQTGEIVCSGACTAAASCNSCSELHPCQASTDTCSASGFCVAASAPARLSSVSGNAQSGAVGALLAKPLVVMVVDTNGNPAHGVTVSWSAVTGGGSVGHSSSVSGSDGLANISATLGPAAGSNTYSASAAGLTGSPVTFTATATVGTAATLAAISPASGSAVAGSQVSLTVLVTDASSNPVAGLAVSWAVVSGGGSLPAASSMSDVNGHATITATLGTAAGTNVFSASASGLAGSPVMFSESGVAGSAAAIAQVTVSGQTVIAATAIGLTVLVTDANGNAVSGQTIQWAMVSGGGSIASSSSSGSDGKATATATLGSVAGTNVFTATAAGLSGSPVTFSENGVSAAPTKLVFAQIPATAQSGALVSAVQVAIEDAAGNVVTDSTAAITVSATGLNGGQQSQNAIGGIATFNNLTITGLAGPTALIASSANLTSANGSITITAGTASQLVFGAAPPGSAQSGVAMPAVTVKIEDAAGNLTNSSAPIALSSNGGTLTGGAAQNAVSGIATFSSLTLTGVPKSYTLTASSSSTAPQLSPTSTSVALGPGPATKLVFLQVPTTTNSGATISGIQVGVEDSQGNLASSSSAQVTITASTGGTVAGNTATAVNGIATFNNFSLTGVVGSYTITAASAQLTSATSELDILGGGAAATQLAFTMVPASASSGVTFPQVLVTVEDADGNLVNTSDSVSISCSTGTLAGGSPVFAVHGVATFTSLSLTGAVGDYLLVASHSGLTSATSPISLTAGVATKLAFTQLPSSASSDSPMGTVLVSVEDDLSNVVLTSTASIGITSNLGVLTGNAAVNAVNGVATFSALSLKGAAGASYSLTASSSATDPALAPVTSPLTLNAGTPSQIVYVTPPQASAASGAMLASVTVAIQDSAGNLTSSTASVSISSSGGTLSGGGAVAAVGGMATFANLSLAAKVGSYTLTAQNTLLSLALTPALSSISISVGSPSQLLFATEPPSTTQSASPLGAVQVSVADPGGNVVTASGASVTMAASGGTLSGTVTIAAVNGSATFSDLSLTGTGGSYTLTATSSPLLNATSTPIAVGYGAATQLAFAHEPSDTVSDGVFAPLVAVSVLDSAGNVVSSSTAAISLATKSGSGALTGASANAVSGIATFSALSLFGPHGSYQLTASSNSLTSLDSSPFNLTFGAETQLSFTGEPPSMAQSGLPLGSVSVSVLDRASNVVSTSTQTIGLSVGPGATVSGGAAITVASGVATFAPTLTGLAGTYTLSTNTSSLPVVASSNIMLNAGNPNMLVFTLPPPIPPLTVQSDMEMPAIKVSIEDAQGNVLLNNSGSTITITANADAVHGTLSGGTATTTAGVATFSALSFKAQAPISYILTAASSVAPSAMANIDLIPGADAQLVFPPATDSRSESIVVPAVTVTMKDSYGNVAINTTASVSITSSGGGVSGGGPIGFTNGVATFDMFSLSAPEAQYTLTATSDDALPLTTQSTLNITGSGQAKQVVFLTQPPSGASSGIPFGPVVVEVRDDVGNKVADYFGTVGLSASISLSGGAAVSVSGGDATFPSLTLTGAGGNSYVLSTESAFAPVVSSGIVLGSGNPAKLVFTTPPPVPPLTVQSDVGMSVSVSIEDGAGNVVGSTGVTITITSNDSNTVSGGVVTTTNGVAAFTALSVKDAAPMSYVLTAASSQVASAMANIDLIAGLDSQLVFLQTPQPCADDALITTVEVEVQDSFGNTASASTASVTITSDAGTILSGNTGPIAFANGVASFTTLSLAAMAGTHTLTATTTGDSTALTLGTSIDINGPGTPHGLAFQTQPPAMASSGIQLPAPVVVAVVDDGGNVVTDSTATVGLTNTVITVTGGDPIPVTNGLASFSLTLTGLHGQYVLSTTSSLLNVDSNQIMLGAGNPSKLAFLVPPPAHPSTVQSDVVMTPTVTVAVEDSGGNVVNDPNVSVTIASNGGTLSGLLAATGVDGKAYFDSLSLLAEAPMSYTLTASTSSGFTDTTADIDLVAGIDSQLVVSMPGPAASEGIAPIQVQIEDSFGNLATGSTASVAFSASGGVLSGNDPIAFSGGLASFSLLSLSALEGVYTLTATTTDSPAITQNVLLNIDAPGSDSKVDFFTEPPSNANSGLPFASAVVVEVLDQAGNLATNSTASIGLNAIGASLTGGGSVPFSGGLATFSGLVLTGPANFSYYLSTTVGPFNAKLSTLVALSAGNPNMLAFTTPPPVPPLTVQSDVAMSPVKVVVEDASGNVVSTAGASVTIEYNNGVPLQGSVATTDMNGVATFTALALKEAAPMSYLLTAVSNGVANATATIDLVAGLDNQLVFLAPPSPDEGASEALIQPFQVEVEDSFGNPATGSTASVTLTSDQGQLMGNGPLAFTNGIATFNSVVLAAPEGLRTLTATSSNIAVSTASTNFTINGPGAVAGLMFTEQPPTTALSGVQLSNAVEVSVVDQSGNVETNSTALFGLTGAGLIGLSGNAPQHVTAGTNTFDLTLDGTNGATYFLTATFGSYTPVQSGPILMGTGPQKQLAFTVQPSSVRAGDNMNPGVAVTVEDSGNNPVMGSPATITLNSSGGVLTPGSPTLNNGTTTFSGLSIAALAASYTLTASSTGFADVVSSPFTVTSGDPKQLYVVQAPNLYPSGLVASPDLIIGFKDVGGNVVDGTSIPAQASVTSGTAYVPGGSVQSSPNSQGQQDFSNLVLVGTVSTPNTLTVSAPSIPATLNLNSVYVSAGNPVALEFTAQPPASVLAGSLINSPLPSISIVDAQSNPVTNMDFPIQLYSVPSGYTLNTNTVGGTAAFTNLSFTQVNTYTLWASAPALNEPTTSSSQVMVTPNINQETLTAVTPSGLIYAGNVDTSISALLADNYGNPIPGVEVNWIQSGAGSAPPYAFTDSSGLSTISAYFGFGDNNFTATYGSLQASIEGMGMSFSTAAPSQILQVGGPGVPVTANTTGTPITWSTDSPGVGMLSSTSGNSIVYTPPTTASSSIPATVMVQATVGSYSWDLPMTLLPFGEWAIWANVPNDLPSQYSFAFSDAVFDGATGLTWQRYSNNGLTQQAALSYCQQLSQDDGQAWRLPTEMELLSIVSFANSSPYINTNNFDGYSAVYWSSNIASSDGSSAFVVDFSTGFMTTSYVNNNNFVRCVQ